MEAVEYLVVGEHADACRVVHVSFVQRAVHCGEGDIVATVGENGAQSLVLVGVVAEDAQAVALGEELAERFGDEVEILVVDTLRRAAEVDGGSRGTGYFRCSRDVLLAL